VIPLILGLLFPGLWFFLAKVFHKKQRRERKSLIITIGGSFYVTTMIMTGVLFLFTDFNLSSKSTRPESKSEKSRCTDKDEAILNFRKGCGFFLTWVNGSPKWCRCVESNIDPQKLFGPDCGANINEAAGEANSIQHIKGLQVRCGTPRSPI
jgi:hypothetical protein